MPKQVDVKKCVLLSIAPYYSHMISEGRKTVELRKSVPKIEPPFKCYVYETLGRKVVLSNVCKGAVNEGVGKIVGEFVCDKIVPFSLNDNGSYVMPYKEIQGCTCMTVYEAKKYGKGKPLYGWHISNFVEYDKPRDLIEFKKIGFMTEEEWLAALYPNTHCHYEAWVKKFEIKRPPQSWCYVSPLKAIYHTSNDPPCEADKT